MIFKQNFPLSHRCNAYSRLFLVQKCLLLSFFVLQLLWPSWFKMVFFFFIYFASFHFLSLCSKRKKKKQFSCVDTTEKMIQKREIMTFKNNPLIAQANVEWKQAFYSLRRCSCFLAFLTCLLFVNNKSLYIALI